MISLLQRVNPPSPFCPSDHITELAIPYTPRIPYDFAHVDPCFPSTEVAGKLPLASNI